MSHFKQNTVNKLGFFLIVLSSSCFAQFDNQELVGKILPAKIIYREGPPKNVTMRYESPDVFCNPYAKFLVYDPQTEWIIKDSTTESILIEAFSFKQDAIWAKRVDPKYPAKYVNMHSRQPDFDESNHITHARLLVQGAINSYAFTHKKLIGYDYFVYTRKLNEQPVEGEISSLETQIRKWVSDSPEIMRELFQADSMTASNRTRVKEIRKEDSLARAEANKDGKRKGLGGMIDKTKSDLALNQRIFDVGPTKTDMNLIVHNYNVWYDNSAAEKGKIKYCLIDPPVKRKSQLETELERRNKREVNKEENIPIKTEEKENLFSNRSTTVSAEMASVKDNIPIKKETFSAKLERIKSDGNKVGVLFVLNSVQSPTQTPSNQMGPSSMGNSMGAEFFIEGEFMDETLRAIGEQYTSEINTALGRTDIEFINLDQIPYKNAKVIGMTTQVDNFWATKYKVVFIVSIRPLIKASVNESAPKNKYSAFINLVSSLMVNEYIGNTESTDSDIIAQMPNFGSFSTSSISQNEAFTNIETVYKQIVEKQSTSMLDRAKTEREQDMKKLIEKKLK